MRKIIITVMALSLAACNATANDEAQDMQALNTTLVAKGCTVSYAGEVRTEGSRHSSKIFLTTCKATDTATLSENTEVPEGKNSTRMDTAVSVDPNYK